MATKGFRKLVDISAQTIGQALDGTQRLRTALRQHHIRYQMYQHEGFVRVFVLGRDLACAKTVFGAVRKGEP